MFVKDKDAEVNKDMRTAQKKQAEKFTALLRSAHIEIKKALEAGNTALAMDLLEQCQAGAIELGETIEAEEGEGFVTVGLVESYCEQLYQTYKQVSIISGVNAHKVLKVLNKSLTQLENSIKNDIPAKREVVFLPYKASMWDSLESVWKAADEDPDCDAYVIPIPYFDRDAEGNFAQMHDESGLYPKYVPITRYGAYDFAKRRPDMIFIHNPYDNNNYVTSVHPAFYSDKLKQYTDNLVYIPYFILGEVDLENEESIKGMAHFVTTPAVVNADKVIVQSENMRQAYVKVMVMVTGEHTRGYWEKKILGLGSPKIDKVLATRKEDVEVPEAWRRVIEKEDGSWKKIIFYNTSVSALLNHNEKMMAKIMDVLQVFKENREDIALLWRPHPLMEATIKSVRPRLWEEYREIVETYRAEGWGIYDDTAEMDRAVALSDAYYGDPSSVVQLCREAGMPVMYQNVEIIYSLSVNFPVWMIDFCINGKEMWFVHGIINALMKCDLNSGKVKSLGKIPNECDIKYGLYYSIHYYNKKLFCVPGSADEFAIYDIEHNRFEKVKIKNSDKFTGKFRKAYVFNDSLYCIPSFYDQFVKFNLKTYEIEYLGNWYQLLGLNDNFNNYIIDTVKINNSCFAALLCDTNIIILYDSELNKFDYIKIGDDNYKYVSIAYYESTLYLYERLSKSLDAYFIDEKKLQRVLIEICDDDFCKMNVINNKYILIEAQERKCTILIDLKDLSWKKEEVKTMKKMSPFIFPYNFGIIEQFNQNNIETYYFDVDKNCLYSNKEQKNGSYLTLKINKEELNINGKEIEELKINLIENELYGLNEFFDGYNYKKIRLNKVESCGMMIFEKAGKI